MKRPVLLIIISFLTSQSFAQLRPSSIAKVDFASLTSRADLVYDSPVSRSEEGMPIGNGTMGSLVWTVPSALKFQINRVDVFANNSGSNNFYERHTDYCNGVGFVDIDFLHDVFTGRNFRQHLSCYDGLVTVKGNGVETRVLAWHERDVMAIHVTDSRPDRVPVTANLRTLRAPVTRKGNHEAISEVKVIDNKILLIQKFHEDDFNCNAVIVIEVVEQQAKAEVHNETTARLVTFPAGEATIFMASAVSFDPEEDILEKAMYNLEEAKKIGFEGLHHSNQIWWQDFWKKSFVRLHSDDGKADLIEKYYTYYLYIMGSSSRGRYPVKFNGMLWTTGGDARKWGSLYWGANQSCLYNALFSANHVELMQPMFNMYSSMYDACATAAVQQWGSKGIFIPETVAFDGMTQLPEDIAEEMRALNLKLKPWEEHSQKFYAYSLTKLPFHSRWNWKKDEGWSDGKWNISNKGGGAFGHVTHIFSRGAKIAYQYWLKYEYTQDMEWLRDNAYPVIKGVAEFYRNFPNIRKERDGKYHIYHVNDNESIWDGHNTVEEISAMMGIFPVAIKAAETLNVDNELRRQWQEILENLSPLPKSTDYGQEKNKPVTWARSLPPVLQGDGSRIPDPNTMPVWFFDLCGLESDPAMLAIANATYDRYFPNGVDEKTAVYVLSKLPSAGALLGRTEATQFLIANQLQTAEVEEMPNRMDLREGFQTTSIQRLGRAAEALHYALCQSVPSGPSKDPVIRVFPAWPKAWNADFKLLCRGDLLVSASHRDGNISFVEILSQEGAPCKIRNPWGTEEITIYRNGKKFRNTKEDLVMFNTRLNDRFILVPKGKLPEVFKF